MNSQSRLLGEYWMLVKIIVGEVIISETAQLPMTAPFRTTSLYTLLVTPNILFYYILHLRLQRRVEKQHVRQLTPGKDIRRTDTHNDV